MDENKVVCDCLGLTVKDIKDAIENGADTFAQLQEQTQIGEICGVCTEEAEEIFNELKNK